MGQSFQLLSLGPRPTVSTWKRALTKGGKEVFWQKATIKTEIWEKITQISGHLGGNMET